MPSFHEGAYSADGRQELLDWVDELETDLIANSLSWNVYG